LAQSFDIAIGLPNPAKRRCQSDSGSPDPAIQILACKPSALLDFPRVGPQRAGVDYAINLNKLPSGMRGSRQLEQEWQRRTARDSKLFAQFPGCAVVIAFAPVHVAGGGGIPKPRINVFGPRTLLQ